MGGTLCNGKLDLLISLTLVGLVCRCNPMGATPRPARPLHHRLCHRTPLNARQTHLHSAELLSASCATAIPWVLRDGRLDIYITITISSVPSRANECQTDALHSAELLSALCAAAIQWVLRNGKLDLYIIVMVLLAAANPACARPIHHHGDFVPHSSKSSRRHAKMNSPPSLSKHRDKRSNHRLS